MKLRPASLRVLIAGCGLAFAHGAIAAGVSPYLPLSTSPAMERKVERVLALAGKPVIRRPIAAAVVLDALPEACQVDAALCAEVRAFLDRYQHDAGITQLQVEATAATGDSDSVIPTAHGRTRQSAWQVTGSAFYQPSDYLLINAGALSYQGRTVPTGSYLSVGFDFAQLDIGYRDHWFSPLSSSSMIISTEAPTLPSVTLSNYRPLGRWRFSYEAFAAQMETQNGIKYFDSTTSGRPRLAGIQFGIEPVAGYALVANRLMQYGGGARGGTGLGDLFRAFYKNTSGTSNKSDNVTSGLEEFGNQIASVTGTMQFPGAVPFSLNVEYAGEDNNYKGDFRLGDVALTLGVDFPKIMDRYDFKYETSEWQNVWYTHHLYPDGITNERLVLGHWFGDQRNFADQVGGRSHHLQIGMQRDSGAYWQFGYRTLAFMSSLGYQTLPAADYGRLHELSVRYTGQRWGHEIGAELQLGKDVLGKGYGRLSASYDFTGASAGNYRQHANAIREDGDTYQLYLVAGWTHGRLYQLRSFRLPDQWSSGGYLFGVGVRRQVAERTDLGMRMDVSAEHGGKLVSIRVLDYRRRFRNGLAATVFGGVGAYQITQSAVGWHWGYGLQWINVAPKWDVGLDFRYYDKMSRNMVVPGDIPATPFNPRLYFDLRGQLLYVTRSF